MAAQWLGLPGDEEVFAEQQLRALNEDLGLACRRRGRGTAAASPPATSASWTGGCSSTAAPWPAAWPPPKPQAGPSAATA